MESNKWWFHQTGKALKYTGDTDSYGVTDTFCEPVTLLRNNCFVLHAINYMIHAQKFTDKGRVTSGTMFVTIAATGSTEDTF